MWGGGESEQPGGILDEHITASPIVALSHLRERGGILRVVEPSVPHPIACLLLFYSNVPGYGSRAAGFREPVNACQITSSALVVEFTLNTIAEFHREQHFHFRRELPIKASLLRLTSLNKGTI